MEMVQEWYADAALDAFPLSLTLSLKGREIVITARAYPNHTVVSGDRPYGASVRWEIYLSQPTVQINRMPAAEGEGEKESE